MSDVVAISVLYMGEKEGKGIEMRAEVFRVGVRRSLGTRALVRTLFG